MMKSLWSCAMILLSCLSPISFAGFSVDASSLNAEEMAKQYLLSTHDNQQQDGEFHIQGFRWHTMSVKREAERLYLLSQRLSSVTEHHKGGDEQMLILKKAVDYVIGFNMNGLQRIEKNLFFPFLREKFQGISEKPVAEAFNTILDELENCQRKVSELGKSLEQVLSRASDDCSASDRSKVLTRVMHDSNAIARHVGVMLDREENLVIPVIARLVPQAEQKSFNNKVIRSLGFLDSRVYLVGMHEVVSELNDESENQLWKTSIPSIPRNLVPRWKRTLYDPKAGILDLKSQA